MDKRCRQLVSDPSSVPLDEWVIVGEGATDFLALTGATRLSVMCVPGTSFAKSVVGPWVKDRRIIVLFDNDDAGRRAAREFRTEALLRGAADVIVRTHPEDTVDICDILDAYGSDGLAGWLESVVNGAREAIDA